MENKTEDKNGRRKNKHHVLPRSRGGRSNGNTIKIPEGFHAAWHVVFGNLTTREAKKFIDIVFDGKGLSKRKKNWNQKELYDLQLDIQVSSRTKKKKNKKGGYNV